MSQFEKKVADCGDTGAEGMGRLISNSVGKKPFFLTLVLPRAIQLRNDQWISKF